MIDNYLWEELVTFAKYKTLAKTAEKLHVTQPTITRGMKKLEDDLGVQLFIRHPNRISLTKTGDLATEEAQAIVSANYQAVEKIKNFDQSQQSISVGGTIPGPLILMKALQSQLPPKVKIAVQLQQNVLDLLTSRKFTLVLSNQEILTDKIESYFPGTEDLFVNLNQFMYQANQPAVTFKELKGLSFLVLNDIGAWNDVITKYSDFPFFSTNLSKFDPLFDQRGNDEDGRIEPNYRQCCAHGDLWQLFKIATIKNKADTYKNCSKLA